MAVTQAISITRHPYADGSYKKMLIDGQWVDAASGKRFETLNPATGELLATVAEGDAEDINRAVAAARRACGLAISWHHIDHAGRNPRFHAQLRKPQRGQWRTHPRKDGA